MSNNFIKTGNKYFIRTITMYYTGTVKDTNKKQILLKNAAWIADTGRLTEALETGVFNEVEVFPGDVIINMDSIVDASLFDFPLPKAAK